RADGQPQRLKVAGTFVARCRLACGVTFFFERRSGHTRLVSDWSSDVCSSDLGVQGEWQVPRVWKPSQGFHRDPASPPSPRSEERRVGEESRSPWAPYHLKK